MGIYFSTLIQNFFHQTPHTGKLSVFWYVKSSESSSPPLQIGILELGLFFFFLSPYPPKSCIYVIEQNVLSSDRNLGLSRVQHLLTKTP